MKTSKNYLQLLLAGFLFSTLAIFSEIATKLSIDGLNQMVWRSFFALITSGVIAFAINREKVRVQLREIKYLIVNGLLLVGGISTFTLGIYLGSPIAKAVALNYAYPLVVIIASYVLFKEKPSLKGWIATVVSLLSVGLLLEIWKIQNLFSLNVGDALELLNSVFYGLIIVYGKKLGNKTSMSPFKSLFYSYCVAVPCLILLGEFVLHALHISAIGSGLVVLSLVQNSVLIGLAVFGMVMPIALIYSAVSKVKAYIAGIFLLTEPLWVYVFGFLLFGQTLNLWGILGMIGIILAVSLV